MGRAAWGGFCAKYSKGQEGIEGKFCEDSSSFHTLFIIRILKRSFLAQYYNLTYREIRIDYHR